MRGIMVQKILLIVAVAATLAGCSTGRWAGFNNCSQDGSPVWWEYPNSHGSFDGLNNGPQYCKKS
jgi:hypothetical protein